MRDKSQNFGSSSSQRSVSGRNLLDLSADGRNLEHRENKARHSVRLPLLDGMRQRGDILSGGSYLSSNDLRGHFGIGDATEAGTTEIHWPSGKKETVRLPAVDRIYTIEEGQGIIGALCGPKPCETGAKPALEHHSGPHDGKTDQENTGLASLINQMRSCGGAAPAVWQKQPNSGYGCPPAVIAYFRSFIARRPLSKGRLLDG